MKRSLKQISLVLLLAALSACTVAPKKDLALERVRDDLNSLKSTPELAGYAPLALGEAERALRMAEQATGNEYYRSHLVYMERLKLNIMKFYPYHQNSRLYQPYQLE